MPRPVVIVTPADIKLDDALQPFSPNWVLSGAPASRSKTLARSKDWAANIVVWECTAGRFKWHFTQDETIFVVSGETIMISEKGEERRLGPGDIGYFPAGTRCTFIVSDRIRKVAVVRESLWRPLGFSLKVWNKLLRLTGLSGKSQLMESPS